MQTRLTNRVAALSTAVACALSACSGGGGDANLTASNGQLTLSLIDSPSTDVSELWLQIDAVRVQASRGGDPLEFDFDPDLEVDLLAQTLDDPFVLLDAATLRARDYDGVEIVFNASFDTIPDSYAVQRVGGGLVEVAIPGQVIRLDGKFTIEQDQTTEFLLDWDTRQGLTFESGDLGYTLLPAIRVFDAMAVGSLRGTVETSLITPANSANLCNIDSPLGDPDIGNVVYVFAGNGATPVDINGIGSILDARIDPVTTAAVARDTAGTYRYSTILAPGDYTLAFTCQAGLDDPLTGNVLLFSDAEGAAIVADEETIVDF